jgi:hypothetical protein
VASEEYERALAYAGVLDDEELSPQERYDKALKFASAAVAHESEQLAKAEDAVRSVVAKLDKMREYADLVVRDADAAVSNAQAETQAIQDRLEAAESAQRILQEVGGRNGLV